MAIKNLIAGGIGFDDAGDSNVYFIPTRGLTAAVPLTIQQQQQLRIRSGASRRRGGVLCREFIFFMERACETG